MVHRGDSCGAEGWFGHPHFTAGSPHFQDPLTFAIVAECRLRRKIADLPRKNLALARSHPKREPIDEIAVLPDDCRSPRGAGHGPPRDARRPRRGADAESEAEAECL